MHELSIAQEILDASQRAARAHGGGRLERVKIAVGELTALEPELLTFAWEALTAEGPERGCTLEIEWRAASQQCPRCSTPIERPRGSWLPHCPRCGEVLRIEGGQELDLLQISFVRENGAKGVEDE